MIWLGLTLISVGVISAMIRQLEWLRPLEVTAQGALSKDGPAIKGKSRRRSHFGDERGMPISMHDRILVNVEGDSCSEYGIFDGHQVVADILSNPMREKLKRGHIVVIDAEKNDGHSPYRLRVITKIENGTMYFKPSPNREWKPKPLADAYARVSFV